jgi:phage terminase large subunit-like protein
LRAFWRHWVPEETLIDTKLRAHARYYAPWARGCICRTTASALERLDCPAWIHVTPGNVTDYDYLRADIAALATRYRINEIAVDKAQATQLMGQLAQDGLTVFEHAQSCLAMHPGISELERIIIGRQFEHSGDPVAAWAFGNVATDQNSYGQKRFEKAVGTKKTGRVMRKIDPMQVLAMATGRAALRVDTFNAVKGAVIL